MRRRPPRSTRTHTLSLHDALPIYHEGDRALDRRGRRGERAFTARREFVGEEEDEQRPEIDHEIEPAMLRRRRCRDRLGASGKPVAHLIFPAMMRSEERRVGKESVSTCKCGWLSYH